VLPLREDMLEVRDVSWLTGYPEFEYPPSPPPAV